MNPDTVIKVVQKLIGNTVPVGDNFSDGVAYDNQDDLIEVTNACIDILIQNSAYKDREEYAAEKIGKKAAQSLQEIYKKIERCL